MSTAIQWTDETWNPLRAADRATGAVGWHCERVSQGCINCYAASLNRLKRNGWGTGHDYVVPAREKVTTYLHEETLEKPLHWGKPRRVFVCSMTDLFGEWVPNGFIDKVFAVMALTPQHTYQVLTKRPERAREYLVSRDEGRWGPLPVRAECDRLGFVENVVHHYGGFPWPLPNVWLGTSCEDQAAADARIPVLLETPAAVRFISAEPLLGPVVLRVENFHRCYCGEIRCNCDCRNLDWVIVGGESGPKARPCDVGWIRSIVQQCKAAGVAAFVKQLGSKPYLRSEDGTPFPVELRHSHGGNPEEWPTDLRMREFPDGEAVVPVVVE